MSDSFPLGMSEKTFSTYALERIRFFSHQYLSQDVLLDGAEARFFIDYSAENLVLALQKEFLGNQKEVRVSYPLNWWEALKDRFFPRWLLSCFPVRKKEHHIKAYELFPKVNWPVSLGPRYYVLVEETK